MNYTTGEEIREGDAVSSATHNGARIVSVSEIQGFVTIRLDSDNDKRTYNVPVDAWLAFVARGPRIAKEDQIYKTMEITEPAGEPIIVPSNDPFHMERLPEGCVALWRDGHADWDDKVVLHIAWTHKGKSALLRCVLLQTTDGDWSGIANDLVREACLVTWGCASYDELERRLLVQVRDYFKKLAMEER